MLYGFWMRRGGGARRDGGGARAGGDDGVGDGAQAEDDGGDDDEGDGFIIILFMIGLFSIHRFIAHRYHFNETSFTVSLLLILAKMKTRQANDLAKVKAPPPQHQHTAISSQKEKSSDILVATCVNSSTANMFMTVTTPL